MYSVQYTGADSNLNVSEAAMHSNASSADGLCISLAPAGRLFDTLFGGHQSLHGSPADQGSQGQDVPEGNNRQVQADTEGQQRAGLERRQAGSAYTAHADAPGGAEYSQQETQGQGMSHHPRQVSTVGQQQQQVSEGQSVKAPSLGEDLSIVEVETDLATAQRAQREALQVERDSLQSSFDSLAELKSVMQTEQGSRPPEKEDYPPPSDRLQPDTRRELSTDLAQDDDVDQELAQSMSETSEVPRGAQQSQREALHVGQQLLQSEREDVKEVEQAVQHQHGEVPFLHTLFLLLYTYQHALSNHLLFSGLDMVYLYNRKGRAVILSQRKTSQQG